jgi:urocanate reductase
MFPNFETKIVSRRTFLKKTAAIGVGTAAAAAMIACTPTQSSNVPKWDKEVDVVVIGGGGAGLTAAISASKAGAGSSVLILEKAAVVGGSTSLSGGVIQAAGTKFESELSQETGDTPDLHLQFYTEAADGIANPDLLKLITEKAPAAIDWMVEQGLTYVSTYAVSTNPLVEEKYRLKRIHVPGGGGTTAKAGTGAVHVSVLYDVVKGLGLEVMLETPVTSLVYDETSGVTGVKANDGSKDIYIKAKKGVVIATSSFDHNKDMARAFSAQQLWELESSLCAAAPTNTGDGIKLGMAVGADLAGMGGTIGVPFTSLGTNLTEGMTVVPGIWVNVNGERFVNEASHYAFAMRAVFNQQSHTAWAIFDDKVRQMGGALVGGLFGGWSDDLKAEVESGLLKTADTLENLATQIGVNSGALVRTFAQYNEDAKAGVDSLLGKKEGLQVMETGPYFAQRVLSWNLGSCGGLKVNSSCQVIDVNGNVIPHLFAAGMAAGGFIGPYYPGSGTAVLITVVTGRIAGDNVAAVA